MSDEEQADVTVSNEEIEAVEQEVKKLNADKEKEIAEKVRAEMQTESKMKELETSKAELEKQLNEQKQALEAARAEQEKAMSKIVEQRVADEVTKRKGLVNNQQPFNQTPQGSPIDNLTPEQQKQIENDSYRAFMDAAKTIE